MCEQRELMLLIHGMRLEIGVDAFRVGSFFTFYFSVFFRLDIIKLKCIVCVCVCAAYSSEQ